LNKIVNDCNVMTNMASTPLSQIIAEAGDRLTPTERRIAQAVLADPTLLAFGTVSDLADKVETSRPSIVRFAAKIGFAGFPELQDHVRARLSAELFSPSQRIRREGDALVSARSQMEQSFNSVFEAVGDERLESMADSLAKAESVWIISGETSRAGAHALLSGLGIIRPRVFLLEERTIGKDLAGIRPGDVAVIIGFYRYRRVAVTAAQILAEAGVEIIAITDGPLSPLAGIADLWCELYVPAIGPFDSSLSTVAMAELLVAEVSGRLQDVATERIDQTERMWEDTGTFYDENGVR
jgi:DNA-binding MurR/RpiR family transcriptional regulator